MTNSSKDYYIKKVEGTFEDVEDIKEKIKYNVIFGVSALLVAGVAFGIGDQIFDNIVFKNIVAYGAVGISGANFNALRNNLRIKSTLPKIQKEESPKQYSKGSK